jgi:hypothetical protein
MKEEKMSELVGDLTHSELLSLKEIVEKEIRLSETAIKEGFEKEK